MNYKAKILLFGEHTVIKGSQALAMPINDFYGSWQYTTKDVAALQQGLPSFQQYLEKQGLSQWIDTGTFSKVLKKGLFFDANIPTGYGMGSSGALCAAILGKFGNAKVKGLSLQKLKELFAQMESFFHGASSGTDPLVSYLSHPILLGETISKVELPPQSEVGSGALFLLNTNVARVASPFIKEFLRRCQDEIYDKKCTTQLAPLVDDAIHTFLQGHWPLLFATMHELSLFQYRYFDFMILEPFKKIWLDGLSSNHFKLKVCGAGGGGFLLGISNDFKETKAALANYQVLPLFQF